MTDKFEEIVSEISKCDMKKSKFKKLEHQLEELAKKKIAIHDLCESLKGDKE